MGKSGMDGVMPKKSRPKKKDGKKKKAAAPPAKGNKNHKAFNVANVVSAKRSMQRNLDKAQQKEVVPLTSRDEAEPPPALVVVMGPAGTGKSTLIRSLVKLYTGQNLQDTKGPITVVAGKARRVTFIECNADLFSMTDLAKVADLVLLTVDASYGLEMETFEFLNLLQLHGFPKVLGVLTHLDKFRSTKSLQAAKKALKHRFWTEIYKGAKMFDFLGVVNGKYRKHEVKRLALYVSRVKFRPLVWRNAHPFLVVDRVEDVTPVNSNSNNNNNNSSADGAQGEREVTLYGYVRGSHLKDSHKLHLVGAGDFDMHSLTLLPDPCPSRQKNEGENGKGERTRSLSKKKENLLYAPLANVGRVSVDRDAMYIELKRVNYSKSEALSLADQQHAEAYNADNTALDGPMQMVRGLQDIAAHKGVDVQLRRSTQALSVFANDNGQNNNDDDDDSEDHDGSEGEEESVGDSEEEEGEEDEEDEYGDEGDFDENEEFNEDEEENDDDDEGEEEEEEESEGENDDNDEYARSLRTSLGETADSERENEKNEMPSLLLASACDAMRLVYGDLSLPRGQQQQRDKKRGAGKRADDDDEFFSVKRSGGDDIEENIDFIDSSRCFSLAGSLPLSLARTHTVQRLRGDEEYRKIQAHKSRDCARALLKQRFVTGGYKQQSLSGSNDNDEDSDAEGDGDGNGDALQDLEKTISRARKTNRDAEDESEDDEAAVERENDRIDEELRALNAQKKANFKARFDDQYDKKKENAGEEGEEDEEEMEESLVVAAQRKAEALHLRNKQEFGEEGEIARQRYEGFRQGLYVRVHIKGVPKEFLQCFDASRPVIAGGLLASESAMGFLHVRVKRHRWHKRILKSGDPLIFSVGWRRYQSIPIYTTSDQNERERFLKYTPEHMHCTASFYGPLVAPNTGVLAYQRFQNDTAGFRIALTGTALEQRATPQIVKKLKLVGTPLKIHKNTAFVSGMFNSALEVSKFEGAKIKTVSGIRGAIKKAVMDKNDVQGMAGDKKLGRLPPGTFRATFEDKILMSDLVVCRMWVNVEPKQFYNPVLSMLVSKQALDQSKSSANANNNGDKNTAEEGPVLPLMRSTAQIRRDELIPQVVNKDSVYKPIVRVQREFRKLNVPAKLQEALPFKSKLKNDAAKNRKGYLSRRAVVLEPEEKKSRAMLQMLSTIRKDKETKRALSAKERQKEKQKQAAREAARFADVHKEEKKRKYRETGLERERKLRKSA